MRAIAIVLLVACGHGGHATTPRTTTVEEAGALPAQAAAVEQGLLPYVLIPGAEERKSVTARMAFYDVTAVGVAVIGNGSVWARTWGVRGKSDHPVPVDDDTLFQVGGLSRPVTAVAVLRLVELGKIRLDENVNAYLHGWKIMPEDQGVTVMDLLGHTSGLSSPDQDVYFHADGSFGGYARGAPLPTTVQLLTGRAPALNKPIEFHASEGTLDYASGGYTVLQKMIEDVTGQPFAAAVKQLVFDPAGMRRSTFAAEPGANAALAHGIDGAVIPGGYFVAAESAADGLWSTPHDLGLFVSYLVAGWGGTDTPILKATTVQQMLRTGIRRPIGDHTVQVALGMYVSAKGNPFFFTHTGHNPGYQALLLAEPKGGRGLVILSNRENSTALFSEVSRAVGEVYDWPAAFDMRTIRIPRVASAPGIVAALAGHYDADGRRMILRADGERLFVKIDDQPENEAYPTGAYEFIDVWDAIDLDVHLDDNGAVRSLEIAATGGGAIAVRVDD